MASAVVIVASCATVFVRTASAYDGGTAVVVVGHDDQAVAEVHRFDAQADDPDVQRHPDGDHGRLAPRGAVSLVEVGADERADAGAAAPSRIALACGPSSGTSRAGSAPFQQLPRNLRRMRQQGSVGRTSDSVGTGMGERVHDGHAGEPAGFDAPTMLSSAPVVTTVRERGERGEIADDAAVGIPSSRSRSSLGLIRVPELVGCRSSHCEDGTRMRRLVLASTSRYRATLLST